MCPEASYKAKSQSAERREVVCNAVHHDESEPSVSPGDPRTLNIVASLTM
ncbi:MAG: hypothetical protein ACJAS1_003449 [Oleiphilaceae bacterium]|jgi:hypothetical protein